MSEPDPQDRSPLAASSRPIGRGLSATEIGAAALGPVWAVVLGREDLAVLTVVLAALVFWRHGENLVRLRAGTEPRIGSRR